VLNNSGLEVVSGGGTAIGATVSGGGRLTISGGGTNISANLAGLSIGGGIRAVETISGGTDSGSTISGAAKLFVSSGGLALNESVTSTLFGTGSNGGLFSFPTRRSSDLVLNNSGLEVVSGGGTAIGVTVSGGGRLTVSIG